MRKEDIIHSQQVDHVSNEYQILSSISHPFIVRLLKHQVNFEGLAQDARHLYIFMEYVPGGELFTHLRNKGAFDPDKAAYF
jgi:protein kinase A